MHTDLIFFIHDVHQVTLFKRQCENMWKGASGYTWNVPCPVRNAFLPCHFPLYTVPKEPEPMREFR